MMVAVMVLGILLLVAGFAGVTGRGAADSRDVDYTLVNSRASESAR